LIRLTAVIIVHDFAATLSVIIISTVPSAFLEPLVSQPSAISLPQQTSMQQVAIILRWLSAAIPLVP
jgi:hypothetical protein